jgi:hypothetical protein
MYVDNIKIDLWEIGCEDVNWFKLAQDMVQCMAFHLLNFWGDIDNICYSLCTPNVEIWY